MKLTDEQIAAIRDRCASYFQNGGLFNPDLMDHAKVSSMLRGCWHLASEALESRAALAGRRMCVNCGKYAPLGHDRLQPLPECVDDAGYSACTFDHTPDEAVDHWRKAWHEQKAAFAAALCTVNEQADQVERLRRERDEARAQLAFCEKEATEQIASVHDLLDHKEATLSARVAELEEQAAGVTWNVEGDFTEIVIGDRATIVRDIDSADIAAIFDMESRQLVGLRLYAARTALGRDAT